MDVKKLATLARLKLTSEEEGSFAEEFKAILAYVDQIKAVEIPEGQDNEDEELVNVMREDNKSNATGAMSEKLLSLSPDRDGDYIKVKKIL